MNALTGACQLSEEVELRCHNRPAVSVENIGKNRAQTRADDSASAGTPLNLNLKGGRRQVPPLMGNSHYWWMTPFEATMT
jgi:hypothetical protein